MHQNIACRPHASVIADFGQVYANKTLDKHLQKGRQTICDFEYLAWQVVYLKIDCNHVIIEQFSDIFDAARFKRFDVVIFVKVFWKKYL